MSEELIYSSVLAIFAMLIFVVGNLLRPKKWHRTSEEDHGKHVFDLMGTFFTAVTAFTIVLCWQNYDSARKHTVAESGSLIETYWLAQDLPEPQRQRIQGLINDYTRDVINREWSVLAQEHRLDRQTEGKFNSLREAVTDIDLTDSRLTDQRRRALLSLTKVAESRHDRAADASVELPQFIYVGLWMATVLLLLRPVLAGVAITPRSVAVVGLLGIVVGTLIQTIYKLDHPLSGGFTVPADAFRDALSAYRAD